MGQYVSNIEKNVDALLLSQVARRSRKVSRQVQWGLFRAILLITDTAMVSMAFWLAYWIRFDFAQELFKEDAIRSTTYYQFLTIIFATVWLALFAMHGLYQTQNLLGGIKEYERIFRAGSIGTLSVIIISFVFVDFFRVARGWLVLIWMLTIFLPMASRFILRRLVYWMRGYGYFLTPAIIIGGNEEGRWLAEQLVSWKTSGLLLVGFVDEKVRPGTHLFGNLFSLGTVDNLDEIISKYQIGELILATSAISSRNKQVDIFKKYGVSGEVNMRMSSGLYEIITTGITVNEMGYVPFITINKARLTGWDEVLKFFMDYAITIPGLLVLSPFLLLVAILIKLDSPGPAIHRRLVMGINGKKFYAYKFRTMYTNGDEILAQHPELQAELAENHKLKDDPRITRIGKFLRKTSIDELLQLFNVLKREMSLVGPRMISPGEVEKYQQWNINLLTVRPGITGPWQVSGRSNISYKERVQIDMYYVRNWTIWLDIKILIETIPAVLKSRGAY